MAIALVQVERRREGGFRVRWYMLLVLAGLAVVALGLGIRATLQHETSQPGIGGMLLTEDDFPAVWKIAYGPKPLDTDDPLDAGSEDLRAAFVPEGRQGAAAHYVYRFANPVSAGLAYWSFEHRGLFVPSGATHPAGWTYRSAVADRSSIVCTPGDDGETAGWCEAMAQYGPYISVFSASLAPAILSQQDMERLLKQIDERMASKLAR